MNAKRKTTTKTPAKVVQLSAVKAKAKAKAQPAQQPQADEDIRLSTRVMLANVNVSIWPALITDREVTQDVATRANVEAKRAGKYKKQLIDREHPAYAAVRTAARELRGTHKRLTAPWAQDGGRVLPAKNFDKYSAAIREKKLAYERAYNAFLDAYPQLVQDARSELGPMWRGDQYPTNIRSKFGCDITILPLPDADDFRIKLPDEDMARVRSDLEQAVRKAAALSIESLYHKLFKHVARIRDNLATPDKKFRDTTITGVAELCESLRDLNFTDDQRFYDLCRQAQEMCADVDPDDLREKPEARKALASKAAEIVDDMQGVMAHFMGTSEADDEE